MSPRQPKSEFLQCEIDQHGGWVTVSQAVVQLLGYTAAHLAGGSILSLLHPDEVPPFKAWLERNSDDAPPRRDTFRFQHREGRTISCEAVLIELSSASANNILLLRDLTQEDQSDAERALLVRSLDERLKELTFLHNLAALLHRHQQYPSALLLDTVMLLPQAFQYPEVAVARIRSGEHEAASPGFRKTDWMLKRELQLEDSQDTRIEVAYLEKRPQADAGPFLREEEILLESVAELLAGYLSTQRAKEKLAASEQRLRLAVEHIPSTFAIYDADLRFTYVNARGLQLSGFPEEAMLGKRNEEILPAESTAGYLPLLHRAAETLTTQSGEVDVSVPGGPVLTASVTFVPVVGPDGNLQQVLSVTHDLTKWKQAEEAIRRSESQLRDLAENLPGVVYICLNDADFTVLYLNAAIEQLTGYSVDDFMQKRIVFPDLFYPDETERIYAAVQTGVDERRPFTITYGMRHKSGDRREVEGYGSGIFVNDELYALHGFISDVTEARRAEREREVFSTIGHKLAAADRVETLGDVFYEVASGLWDFNHFQFSVRRSGKAWQQVIVQAHNGSLMVCPPGEPFEATEPLLAGENIAMKAKDRLRPGASAADGNCSLLSVPIHASGRLLGILTIALCEGTNWSEPDLRLFRRLADASGPALERCRAEERSRALSELGELLSSVTTPQEAALAVVQVADNLIGWDASVFNLYEPKTDTLHQMLAYDIVNGARNALPPDPEPVELSAPARRCLEEGPLLILREGTTIDASIRRFGDEDRPSASLMWVPVRGGEGTTGLLSIQSYRQHAYSEEDLQVLHALGSHCGNALERARAQQALHVNEERYRRAINEAGAVAYQRDYLTDSFAFVGEGIEQLTGYSADEFTPQVWHDLVQEVVLRGAAEGATGEDVGEQTRLGRYPNWRADMRIKTKTGEERWIADTSIELRDEQGVSRGSLGILQDITERKLFEQELLHSALHDPLTGLANRVLLLDHLEQAIVRSRRRNLFDFAVLFLDLDRFKNVNDSLGHLAGDKLLTEVAQRLLLCVRPGDTVARFAGDEFVLLLEDVRDPTDINLVTDRILTELAAAVQLEGQEVFPSASIGVVFSSPEYTQPEELLRDADNALYRAKAGGKGRFQVFNAAMYKSALANLSLETSLRKALDREELLLYYQPIVHVSTGQISHFEALLRWHHPERGLVPPADFIPIAEETGLINRIGYWVVETAARQLRLWQQDFGRPELAVTVNLSARQFAQQDFDKRIIEIVRDEGLAPASLKLEITETILMEKQEVVMDFIQRLKAAGFEFYLDDFGTGYSSLNYLHLFPMDNVKIDRSFIAHIEQAGKEREIVRSIVMLAAILGLGITAEGVETQEQLEVLRSMNCTWAQGYYFSRPVPAEAAAEMLRSRTHFA